MSGSKTRVGFSGGSDPPDTEETRAARTVFGHEAHLRPPAEVKPARFPVAPSPVPADPPAWSRTGRPLPIPRDIEFADENPRRHQRPPRERQGESRLARFLGRWTKSGRFLPKSRMNADAHEHLGIPRDTAGRNILLVLLVALLTFVLTFAVVKLRQHRATYPAAPTEPTPAAVPPPRTLLPSSPVSPPTPPAPPSLSPVPAAPATPIPAAAKGLGVRAPAARTQGPARTERALARPPDRLKSELLPLRQ